MRVERGRALSGRTSHTTRRLPRLVVVIAMVVVGLLLALDVAYFARGSLESFPTDEQQDKVRTVTTALAAVLVAAELMLWWLLRRLMRDR